MALLTWLLAGALLLSACRRADYPALPASGVPSAGTYRGTLTVDGRVRRFLVHLPERRPPTPALVLIFHGGGGDAAGQMEYSGMNALADEHGFVVLYPDGSGRLPDRLLTWNAGGCCGYARDQGIDDVTFSLALLDEVGRRIPIDRARVYASGLSNGAMMAYRLAAEAPQAVAAIAPVAGAMLLETFDPGRPVPVLHFHSVDDPRALYDGGLGPPFPLTTHRVEHAPVETVVRQWAEHNGCRAEPVQLATRVSRSDPDAPDHTAALLAFPDCPPGGEVRLWKMATVGHVWPGRPRYLESVLGPSTDVLDANREMWAFFEEFGRQP